MLKEYLGGQNGNKNQLPQFTGVPQSQKITARKYTKMDINRCTTNMIYPTRD